MAAFAEALAQALEYHKAGDFERAGQIYQEILQADPAQAEPWFYLGAGHLARGRWDEAVRHLKRALELRPGDPLAQNNLGIALAQRGKWEEAVPWFRQAIQNQPESAQAYNNLAIALSTLGRLFEAERCCRSAIQLEPRSAQAYSNLGLVLATLGKLPEAIAMHEQALRIDPALRVADDNLRKALAAQEQLGAEFTRFQVRTYFLGDSAAVYTNLGLELKNQGRVAEAIACFQEALRLRNDLPEAYNNLGNAFQERGNLEEAEDALRKAIALRPEMADAHNNLGIVLGQRGQVEEAIACYQKALALRPDLAQAHNNLAGALRKLGRYAEAHLHYERALAVRPDYPEALQNLGSLLVDMGRPDEGMIHHERALELKPDYANAQFGQAVIWLQRGDFERGWPAFELRWKRKEFPPRPFAQPVWDGSPLAGRTILLHAEQGLGDTLQFIRYAPLVKQLGGTVIVEAQEALLSLLATCSGIDQLVASGSTLPRFDTHAPLMSLPRILGTTLATVPAAVPYLFADPQSIERWRSELGGIEGFKVGIAWQGNPDHTRDRLRSVALDRFARLAGLGGVRLVSLQVGPGTEQLAAAAGPFALHDLGSRFQSFQDTAAAVMNLDLVITIDSAVAHCAGALAAPVWLLLPYAAEWRWLLKRDDSPWYPTMRLFRQAEPRDWDRVFDCLVEALSAAAARR